MNHRKNKAMKNILKKFSSGFKWTLAVVALCAVALSAVAQFTMPDVPSDSQYSVVKLTGVPILMPTVSISNSFTSLPVALEKNSPLSIWFFGAGTNSGAVSNVIATFRLGYGSTSATNFATTPVLTVTNVPTGSNQFVTLAQFNTNQLQGARSILLYQLSNTNTQSISIWKIVVSQFR